MALTDKLNRFIADIQGQFEEIIDRSNIYQCFDLAEEWLLILGIPLSTISHLYAYQIYSNPNSNTLQYFDILPNTPTFIPQDGDIAVFGPTQSNVAGHVGIALSGGTINSFPLFNQNYPLGTNAHIGDFNYNIPKLLGVLRPKIITPAPLTDPTIALKKQIADLQDKINKAKFELNK